VGESSHLTWVELEQVRPSVNNCRLFIDTDDLKTLVGIYEQFGLGQDVVLPDAPILRKREGRYEILAGERRITAALMAGLVTLPCRTVEMSDEEAFLFQLSHNQTRPLTTVEVAFRAAEMERMGFTQEEIATAIPGVALGRYVTVGKMIDRDWFTDDAKQCDPSIVEWFEAAQHGRKHFRTCFYYWVTGQWDSATCSKRFRKRGEELPIDNAEKGFRVTRNLSRFIVRGTLDLDLIHLSDARKMLDALIEEVQLATEVMLETGMFGPRDISLINPTTVTPFAVEEEDDNYDE
jgi:hypothetical protein